MRPRKTILCVESTDQALSVRKYLLEIRGGYRVIACESSAEALELLRSAVPGSVDLLLADLTLPQMDGNELARRSKQLLPCLPTLLTSNTVTSFERACHADGFLPKGACSATELLDRIGKLTARKRGPKKQVQSAGVEQQDFAVAS